MTPTELAARIAAMTDQQVKEVLEASILTAEGQGLRRREDRRAQSPELTQSEHLKRLCP